MKNTELSFGMITNLFDRFTNNIGWFNIPFLLYTVALYTIKYLPFLSEHAILYSIFIFIMFVVVGVVVMYLDWRYVFQSERDFQYRGLEYFVDNFSELKQLLQAKKQARIIARNMVSK